MANTYTLINSVTVGAGGTSSIDFNSIPSTYTDLVLVASTRSNRSTSARYTDSVNLKLNGVETNMTYYSIEAGAGSAFTQSGAESYLGSTSMENNTTSTFGSLQVYIPNYAGSNYKSVSSDTVGESNGTAYMGSSAVLWSQTAAVTSVGIRPGVGTAWLQYSTAYLYGIKNS